MMKYVFMIFLALGFAACSDDSNANRYMPRGEVINKQVYKVGIHPYLNSKKMFASYRPILNYLEEHIPESAFLLETSSDYAAYDSKLYRGDFDFSLPNPYQTYNALSHHYHVVAKMKPDAVFRGIFVARKDSALKEVAQLKSRAVSFPAPTALAATMMPLYYLHEHGINTETEIKKHYVGSQYSSILNAYSSDTIAAATWPPPWEAWCRENPEKAKEMEVVWQTEPLINNGFVVRDDIDPKLTQRIVALLVGLSSDEKGKKLLKNAGFEGFERATDATYDVVETFLEQYDNAIGLPK